MGREEKCFGVRFAAQASRMPNRMQRWVQAVSRGVRLSWQQLFSGRLSRGGARIRRLGWERREGIRRRLAAQLKENGRGKGGRGGKTGQ
jgi:predicted metal-dependent peptidase